MIKIDSLNKTYDKNTRHSNKVLHGISLALPDKGFVCILGPSGCGKTSLLNAIGGLDRYDSGTITTEDTVVESSVSPEMEKLRCASFGYIFQNYYLLSEHSVGYNVYLGMHSLPISSAEKRKRAKEALEKVNMLRYSKRKVSELSGGQAQRVAIARAIAKRPRVIFADEPTGNLDEANTMNICAILKGLSKDSLVVMVTHEERTARFFADRIISLKDGKIVSDSSEWEKGSISFGQKDTLYSGDYLDESVDNDKVSLRLLTSSGADKVNLTVVAEKDKIVIKVKDPRSVICSEENDAPYIAEGKRPILTEMSFNGFLSSEPEAETNKVDAKGEKADKRKKRGLEHNLLWAEARSLLSAKKLKRFGTGIFIILLTLALSLSFADIITVAHIDPEDFITIDSHYLRFSFERGPNMTGMSINDGIGKFREHLSATGSDFDYIPTSGEDLAYKDSTFPQLGNVSLILGGYSWVNISRLDKSTLISGRMPERSDEVVIDRWAIDALLEEEGVIQNVIPNRDYLLGKSFTSGRRSYKLTVVGICDSGERSMYMSKEAMLAFGSCGSEVITLSEYRKITGDDAIEDLDPHHCIALIDNIPGYSNSSSVSTYVGSFYHFRLDGVLRNTDSSIGAKLIIPDSDLDGLYDSMIASLDNFNLWCNNKGDVYHFLENEMPEELKGLIDIEVNDVYARDYSVYEEQTRIKFDSRVIVTLTLILACAVMMYLMQRSKLHERMDLVAVYRLLGIPKMDLMGVFAAESVMLTAKYALPTVVIVWIGLKAASVIEYFSHSALIYPLWAACLTFAAITIYRLLIAVIPIAILLTKPPARLAAKYDF